MQSSYTEKLLLNTLRIIPYEPGCVSELTDRGLRKAMTVNENLKSLGFTLSPRDIGLLAVSPSCDGLYERVRALMPEVKADPMYPDFPEQVMNLTEAQLRLHQLMHYASTYGMELLTGGKVSRGWLPDVEKTEKTEEDTRLLKAAVVELVEEEKVPAEALGRILGRRERLTLTQKELVLQLAPCVSQDFLKGIRIPFKDNISLLFPDVLDHLPKETALQVLAGLCQHTGDVLNNIEFRMKERKYHFRTSEKRLLVKLLESFPAADFRANLILSDSKRERNLKILRHLDYNLYSRSLPHKKAVADLRDGKLVSWESMMKRKLLGREEDALAFAAARPGILVRMLSWLLTLGYSEEEIAEAARQTAGGLSTQTLVKLLASFRSETEEAIRMAWNDEIRTVENKYAEELRKWNADTLVWEYRSRLSNLEWRKDSGISNRTVQAEREKEEFSSSALEKRYQEELEALMEPVEKAAAIWIGRRNQDLSRLENRLKEIRDMMNLCRAMMDNYSRLCKEGRAPEEGSVILAQKHAEYAAGRLDSLTSQEAKLLEKAESIQDENRKVTGRIREEMQIDAKKAELKAKFDRLKEESGEKIARIDARLAEEKAEIQSLYEKEREKLELELRRKQKVLASSGMAEISRILARRDAELSAIGKKYQNRIRRLKTIPERKRIILSFLAEHLARITTPLRGKKVWLDPGLFDLRYSCLEMSDKSGDSTYIPSGLCFKIPEKANVVRFFVYWNDRTRVDIDLHASAERVFIQNGKEARDRFHVGWCSNFKKDGVIHSGDITHSNAAEYIDVNLNHDGSLSRVFLNVDLFSGHPHLSEVEECYIGLMAVDKTGRSVRLYDPANCFFTHEIRQNCKGLYYGYLDVKNRYVRFIGKPNQFGYYSGELDTDPDRNLYVQEYLDLLIAGQEAEWCDNPDEAEVLLTVDKSDKTGAISLIDQNFFLDAV